MMDKHAETEDHKEENWEVHYTTFRKITDRPWGKTTTTFWIDMVVRKGKIIAMYYTPVSTFVCAAVASGLSWGILQLGFSLPITRLDNEVSISHAPGSWILDVGENGTQPQSYLKSADALHNIQQCQRSYCLLLLSVITILLQFQVAPTIATAFSTTH